MAFSTQQRLDIKRHLNEAPGSTILDPLITTMEDGAALETHTGDAVTACNDAIDAYILAQGEVDELTEGGGARFNHSVRLNAKRQIYRDAVENLARILSVELPRGNAITGFFAS